MDTTTKREMSELEMSELEKEYVSQLTPFQKIAYDIAVKKLESSFNITLSIGYLEFLAAKSKTPES